MQSVTPGPRRAAAFSVIILLAASLLPVLLLLARASAANYQVNNRSITLSTSQVSSTGNIVTPTLTISFTPQQTAQEVIVDFCSNDPLVGDNCTATTNSGGTPTAYSDVLSVASPTATGWTASALTGHTLRLTGGTLTAGTPVTISVTAGITNPNNIGTVFGRILTYATGDSASYDDTTGNAGLGNYLDYGGTVMAITQNINISSKVFETLTFCVYNSASSGTCGTAPNIWLGDPVSHALSPTTPYVNNDIKYNLSANAGSGVSVVLRGPTLCRDTPLTSANCTATAANAYTITQVGTTAAVINDTTAGTEQFGLCAGKGTSTVVTVAAPYNDANCSSVATGTNGTGAAGHDVTFGFDGANTNAAAGSVLVSSAGAVPVMSGNIAFGANIDAVTEAGLYSTSLNLVATPTY